MKRASIIILASFVFLVSCSSTTMIVTEPAGATVYMDGQKKGTTPYKHTDTKIAGSQTRITFKKDGYEKLDVILTRNEQADVGAIVGGIFFLVPFFWVMEYYPEHIYELEEIQGNPGKPIEKDFNVNEDSNSTKELIKLKNLLDEGAITQDDFTTLKVKILNEEYDYENSASEEIRKLWELRNQDLLTGQEYNSQKNKIINKN